MHAFSTMRSLAAASLIVCPALLGTLPAVHAQDVTLEVWSHEADEPAKVAFRELAARSLARAHSGVKVKITWYEKSPLFAALKTGRQAGQGREVLRRGAEQ